MVVDKILYKAWENYKKNFATFIGGLVLSVIIPTLIVTIPAVIMFLPLMHVLFSSGFSAAIKYFMAHIEIFLIDIFVLLLLSLIVFPPFSFGFIHLVKKGRKRKAKVQFLFEGVKIYWKKAILQQVLSFAIFMVITAMVAFPAFFHLKSVIPHVYAPKVEKNSVMPYDTVEYSHSPGFALFVFLTYFSIWFLLILVVSFFLLYWRYEIVNFDCGVIEGLKRSISKVRHNLFETFVVCLIIALISAVAVLVEKVIPIIPTLLISPLLTSILVEASAQLKEKSM